MGNKRDKKELLRKATEILGRCKDVVIASVNTDGFPRPVPVSIMKSEGCNKVWMSTGVDSVKTTEFLANPKAGLCYSNNGDSVVMRGTVEIIDDDEMRNELWKDWMIYHFPEGSKDPNYVLLLFTGFEATVWIENQFERLSL